MIYLNVYKIADSIWLLTSTAIVRW